VLRTVLAIGGGSRTIQAPRGVELTRRRTGDKEWVFVLNHTREDQKVSVPGKFSAVVGNGLSDGALTLRGYDLAVLEKV
jgi:beta-galactosidase GanA